MRGYLLALKHGFTGVFRFSGRDGSVLFWSYAATILFLAVLTMMAGMIPVMAESMAKMQEFAVQNPEQVTIQHGPNSYSISVHGNHPGLFPDMSGFIEFTAIVSGATAILLAAAVSRRLHDTGLSGFWGLIPVPFLVLGFGLMPDVFEDFGSTDEPDMGKFFLMFFNNLLYIGSLGLLLFLLIRKSKADLPEEPSANINDGKQSPPAHHRP